MDFELPYMAQRRIQAKRMGRLFPPKEEAWDEDDDEADSILFSIASEDDGGLEDGEEEGGAALLGPKGGGGVAATWSFSVTTTAAALYPRPAPPPGPIDRLVRLVGVCVTPAWLNPGLCFNPTQPRHTTTRTALPRRDAGGLPSLPAHGAGGHAPVPRQ